ncbi:MAG: transcriptional regulator [Deltaproteobacteria bacterium]|nr:transcriptional regulator [Deltaproteobacteria bacterium]MBW2072820.1 transcriptional regulator [Deltaproteobacteria bacterium]
MARGDQLARQWRIIQTLITSKHGKTVAELVKEENCHPRTIYRDLEALQAAGFPIYSERIDGKGIWSVVDEYKHHLPVPFTLTELMALYFSRDLISVFRGTMFYESLESLFQKIKTTLPPESLAYLDSVEQTLYIGFKPHKDYRRFREIIKQINEAAVNHRTIDMIYRTMSRGGEENRRQVDPYKVMFFDSTFYLIGHCHLRNEVRMFVLDRIKMMNVTNRTFEIPRDFDLASYMQSPFRVIHDKPVKVKIRFHKSVAGYIKEKIWHHTQKIKPQKDGSIIFTAEVAGTDEVRHWVLSYGNKAEVLEPQHLREEIASELIDSLDKYSEEARKAQPV